MLWREEEKEEGRVKSTCDLLKKNVISEENNHKFYTQSIKE